MNSRRSKSTIGIMLLLFIFFQIVVCYQNLTHTENNETSPKFVPSVRLPKSVIPVHYKLILTPHLDDGDPIQFKAPGQVWITVECNAPVDSITLHSHPLTIIDEGSITVREIINSSENVSNLYSSSHHGENETFTIKLKESLNPANTYQIFIEFVTPVNEIQKGLYRGQYFDEEANVTRHFATTQFQDIDARRAFPCWDEPGFKSTFDIILGRNAATGYHTLSNMDILTTTDMVGHPGWKFDQFQTTPKMSTYILAMIVSDFVHYEHPSNELGKPVKIWAEKSVMGSGNVNAKYAAETTAKHLTILQNYFNASYELPKMDSVELPKNYFPYGAMENWGLITYSAGSLLFEEGVTSERERKWITNTIAHEVAHQWFGNVVTCSHWNEIWLNEGFAIYVAYIAFGATDPEYEADLIVATDSIQTAMAWDEGNTSLPMWNDPKSPTPGGYIHHKASCVLRMTKNLMTEEKFKNALRAYVRENWHGSVTQNDLFRVLDQEMGNLLPDNLTITEFLNSWSLQNGFPLVRVKHGESRGKIFVTQERFVTNTSKTIIHPPLNPTDLWWIPINFITGSNLNLNTASTAEFETKFWLAKDKSSHELNLNETESYEWILFNPDTVGYYRVLYDEGLTRRLKNQLDKNASVISPLSRSQLLDDYFIFAFNGYASIETAMNFTTYLSQEDKLIGWIPVLKHLRKAFNLLRHQPLEKYDTFKNYMSSILEPALETIGVDQTPQMKGNNVQLRGLLMEWSCQMNSSLCANYTTIQLANWLSTGINSIPPDLQPAVYCTGVRMNDDNFNFILNNFQDAKVNSTQRSRLLSALACGQNVTKLNSILATSFSNESMFKKFEAPTLLKNIGISNPVGFAYLENNLKDMQNYLGKVDFVAEFFTSVSNYYSTDKQINRLEDFIQKYSEELATIKERLNGSIQTIRANVQWMNTYGDSIVEFCGRQLLN